MEKQYILSQDDVEEILAEHFINEMPVNFSFNYDSPTKWTLMDPGTGLTVIVRCGDQKNST